MLTFMNSKLPDKLLVLTSKNTFFKDLNPRKYPVQTCTYIGEDLEFIIHIFYWCIPLDHEIYTKGRIKHLTWLKIYLVTLRSLIDLRLLIFRKLSTQDILIPHPCGYLFSENVPARTSLNLDSNKKPFQYFSKHFSSQIIFCLNFRSHCIVVSNWKRKESDCVLLYQEK